MSFQRSQKLWKRVEESTSLRSRREQDGCVHCSLRFYLWVNLRSYGKEKLERIKKGLMEDLLTGKVRVNHLIEEGERNEN